MQCLQSAVTPKSFCECVFLISKVLADILVFILWIEKKRHWSGFAFIVLLKSVQTDFWMHIQVFSKPYLEFFRVYMEYCHQRNLQHQYHHYKKNESHKNILKNTGLDSRDCDC